MRPNASAMQTEPQKPEPAPNCALCPRLVEFRETNAAKFPDWFNGAVPSFGDENAELLIIGLAPGLKGANRTGRPFTGDYAGDLLYPTLLKFKFAHGHYGAEPNDGLTLSNCMITNAVRCVPPQNKPIGEEITNCRPFLLGRMDALPNLACIITLGRIAHETLIRATGGKQKDFKFAHGAAHTLAASDTNRPPLTMFNSYHCSRYNTNTGRLTTEMFEDVFRAAKAHLSR